MNVTIHDRKIKAELDGGIDANIPLTEVYGEALTIRVMES